MFITNTSPATKNSKHAPATLIGSELVMSDVSMRNVTGNARVKRIYKNNKASFLVLEILCH